MAKVVAACYSGALMRGVLEEVATRCVLSVNGTSRGIGGADAVCWGMRVGIRYERSGRVVVSCKKLSINSCGGGRCSPSSYG